MVRSLFLFAAIFTQGCFVGSQVNLNSPNSRFEHNGNDSLEAHVPVSFSEAAPLPKQDDLLSYAVVSAYRQETRDQRDNARICAKDPLERTNMEKIVKCPSR